MPDEQDEERIFHFARKLPPEDRAEYLDQVCDGECRTRVEGLLNAADAEDGVLGSQHELASTEAASNPLHAVGDVIGRYKLLQKIGEGGFGAVYMAEQSKPVRRKVALKVIKPGMDSDSVVARFEAERQALALMEHPNIARVFDGGATEEGRPYFVMELVKGVPITEYCDANKLPTRQRLELFGDVCLAVQHAHQKGIIHRDLKPSNILVTLHDGKPVVKVIDFGVSKALNQQLTEKTLFTAFGQMVGTPQYMSPEQAEMSGLDVDTRSDVYSLGVILYELLTGSTPLEAERLRSAGYAEMQRLIKEEEPPRPSNRLSTSGEKLTIIAKHRNIAPEKLARQVKGDLDWIVMKALEKERNRRYESPNAFHEDVLRFVHCQPVVARPPSVSYRLRKYVYRNRIAAVLTTTLLISLLTGLAVVLTTNQLLKARNDDLLNAKGKLEESLELRNHALIEMCMLYAMHGDAEKVNGLLESAGPKFPEDWKLTLKGLVQLHRGENEDAFELLRRANTLNPENLSAKSLLTLALIHTGRWGEWSKVMDSILHAQPGSEYRDFDELFLGYAWFYLDYNEADERMGKVIQRNPTWFIANAMWANVGAHVAEWNHDETRMREALDQNRLTELLTSSDNPFTAMMNFYVYRTALVVLSDEEIQEAEVEEKAAESVLRLENDPSYVVGTLVRSVYYESEGKPEEARQAWKELQKNGIGTMLLWASAGLLMQQDEEGGQADLSHFISDERILGLEDLESRASRAILLAVSDEGQYQEQAYAIYQEMLNSADTWYERVLLIQIPLLLGRYPEANAQCQSWLKDESQPPLSDVETTSVTLLSGGAKLMIEEIADMSEATADVGETARWYLSWQRGLIEFSRGNHASAVRILDECARQEVSAPGCWIWYAKGLKRIFEKKLTSE